MLEKSSIQKLFQKFLFPWSKQDQNFNLRPKYSKCPIFEEMHAESLCRTYSTHIIALAEPGAPGEFRAPRVPVAPVAPGAPRAPIAPGAPRASREPRAPGALECFSMFI